MDERIEFGNFADNVSAHQLLEWSLRQAPDEKSVGECIETLEGLSCHINNTNDARSVRYLLPHVLETIAYAKTRVRALHSGLVPPAVVAPSESSVRQSVARFLKSFGAQESFLCVDFLLVLSVLVFNVVITATLSYLDAEIKRSLEPIVRVTDIYLVGIFCAECMALLTIAAVGEVVNRARHFGGLTEYR